MVTKTINLPEDIIYNETYIKLVNSRELSRTIADLLRIHLDTGTSEKIKKISSIEELELERKIALANAHKISKKIDEKKKEEEEKERQNKPINELSKTEYAKAVAMEKTRR